MTRREQLKSEILASLHQIVKSFQVVPSHQLISAALFGSGARLGVKPDSDLDLLFIFDTLPSDKIERENLLWPILKNADNHLKVLKNSGLHRHLSPVFKTKAESLHWSPLYLDMVDCHVLLLDEDEYLAKLLANVDDWIKASGSVKIQRGLKWYWRLGDDPSVSCHLTF